MNFGFSEEQNLLREQVLRFMQDNCPMSQVRELVASDTPLDRGLWQQMADLGWLGMITPADYGGVGLNWVDVTVVLEETGRGLCPLPLASHLLATAAVIRCGNQSQRSRWLPAMAQGSAVCTLALCDDGNWIHPDAVTLSGQRSSDGVMVSGTKPLVGNAEACDYLVMALRVDGELVLAGIDTNSVSLTPQNGMDRTKPAADVHFDNLLISNDDLLPLAETDFQYLCDLGAVITTAEMVGAAEAALQMTSEYARERIQFGKPIGQYQGVKHRLADMFVDVESFKSLLYYAAWTVDDAVDELPRAISLAKGYAADAFAQIGIDAVGLHGAIGFTAEYDIQMYLKRSKWARPAYGDSDYHLERVATLGGL
jgi:acyl-CoA dehydrogenase